MSLSPMATAALAYARRGWPVFPCRERTTVSTNAAGNARSFNRKAPYGGSGLKDATCDEARVTAWWRDHPHAMIGVPLGVNGCFALDFDPRTEDVIDPETGEVMGTRAYTLEQLKAELEAQMGCALPRSLTALTPSGGVHVYFRQPQDGGPEIRNRGNLPQHVDVRGRGGYVIAPPSIGYDDQGEADGRYRWMAERGDWRDDAAIAEAPAELIAILRAPKARTTPPAGEQPGQAAPARAISGDDAVDEARRRYALAALDGELGRVRSAGSGRRNAQLNESAFAIARLVAAGVLDAAMGRAGIEAAARDNPGRDDAAQLTKTIESGWNSGLAQPYDLSDIGTRAQRRSAAGPAPRARPGADDVPRDSAGPPERTAAPAPPGDRQGPIGIAPDGGIGGLNDIERARVLRVTQAWARKRIEHGGKTPEALERTAFSIGRRVAAELIERDAAEEMLGEAGEAIAGANRDAIARSLDAGMHRAFEIGPLLLTMRCAGYPTTDLGNAERFRDRHGDSFRFTTAKGWLGWDGRRWKVLDQEQDMVPSEVMAAVFDTVRAIQDEARFVRDSGFREHDEGGMDVMIYPPKNGKLASARLAEFGRASESSGRLGCIANLAKRWLTVSIEEFDTDALSVNCLNGTLRFTRGRDGGPSRVSLCPHRREDLNTKLAPVEYDATALAAAYDELLAFAQPTHEMRRYLHAWAGYSASGDVSEQKLMFWYGLGGNGKSTVVDAWALALGDYAGTIGIETFLDQGIKKRGDQATPDLARLGGVRLLRASEPDRGAKLNESLIKAATGGEPMAVRALHKGFFDLRPLFKLIISGNSKPDIPGTDEGIWRRVKLVPWLHAKPKDEIDRALPDKLKGELPGIFAHIVRGLLDWLENGLVEPEAVTAATAEYREQSDPLARFLTDCTAPDLGGRVQASDMHALFAAWCKAAGEREWSIKGLGQALRNKGVAHKHSNGTWWLDLMLTREPGDFVDDQGRVRELDGPMRTEPPPPPDPDDYVPGYDDVP